MRERSPLMDLKAATMMAPDWRVVDVETHLSDSVTGEPRGVWRVNDQMTPPVVGPARDVHVVVTLARRDDDTVRTLLTTTRRSPWTMAAHDEVQRLCRVATTPPRSIALPLRMRLDVDDYTVTVDANGYQRALRHGEPWRDLCGDQLIGALANRLHDAWDRLGVADAAEFDALPERPAPPTRAAIEATLLRVESARRAVGIDAVVEAIAQLFGLPPAAPKMCEEHGRPLAQCIGEDP